MALLLSASATFAGSAVVAQTLDSALATQEATDKAASASQKRINEIRDRAQDAAGRYATAVADAESLEKYNAELNKQVASQKDEMTSIERQLLDIETTNREVQPLMVKMVEALERFVALDVPFMLEERTARVDSLKEIMSRADVTLSEKYRRIMEAYQIELENGRTLDTYFGQLGTGPDARTVSFVRLGRVSLLYQSLDGNETGYWDASQKEWVRADQYAHAVSEARRIARKDGPPDLLRVPVPAPQEVR
ncbi:MAG: DUF3450 domain-containing protein [Porticoccaceae bacterium]